MEARRNKVVRALPRSMRQLGPEDLAFSEEDDLFFKHSSPHLCWGGLLVWLRGRFSS